MTKLTEQDESLKVRTKLSPPVCTRRQFVDEEFISLSVRSATMCKDCVLQAVHLFCMYVSFLHYFPFFFFLFDFIDLVLHQPLKDLTCMMSVRNVEYHL